MQKYSDVFQDTLGNALTGAAVSIFTKGTSTLATIYSDNGVTTTTNPLTTDSSTGTFSFYAADGRYDIQAVKAGYVTQNKKDILLFDSTATSSAASINTIQSGNGSISEDLQSRGRWSVLITDFLSTADRASVRAGTKVTIDTALTNAIAALPTNGGDILFPPGAYKITTQPTLGKTGIRFKGSGSSVIDTTGSSATVIYKASTMTTSVINMNVQQTTIEDITFVGEAGNTGDGLQLNAQRCVLRNVSVFSMGQDGIRIGDYSVASNANVWRMDRVKSKFNGRHGIYIHDVSAGVPNVNAGSLIDPDIESNTGDGIKYGNARLNTQVGGTVEANTGAGVHITNQGKSNSFFGGDWEANAAAQSLLIDAGGTNNTIVNSTLTAALCTINEPANRIDALDFNNLQTGVKFPPTQVASADVNTLDDYKEGTWTPSVTFATPGDLAVTYSVRLGRYTKVGNQVTAHCEITTSAFTYTTAVGNLQITGWPYAANAAYGPTGSIILGGWTLAGVSNLSIQFSSTTQVVVYASRSGAAVVTLTKTEVPSGGTVVIACDITYSV